MICNVQNNSISLIVSECFVNNIYYFEMMNSIS